MSHEGEEPHHRVLGSLTETSPDRSVLALSDGVNGHTADSKVALFLCKPPGIVGEVREKEESDDSDQEGDDTLEDEEPLPARDARNSVEAVEDTSSNQTSESSGEDVTSVQDGNASGDLLAVVEH